ncbi:hypothetical protein CC2G_001746 [Coprinopsis cinerea AmutBmut pab1-1]|nr:hypothetical protein CC2G_001746 [Coprinopsis cinerea AmutBmut pab1-1]
MKVAVLTYLNRSFLPSTTPLTMEDPVPSFSMTADAQDKSPLYSAIPPEIRLEIFELAVTSYPDPSRPYPFSSRYYRAGFTAPRRTDLALLRTCQKVYSEARELVWKPSTGNDECMVRCTTWERRNDVPPESVYTHSLPNWLFPSWAFYISPRAVALLSAGRNENITKLHIFTSLGVYMPQGVHGFFKSTRRLHPREIKLTIQYALWTSCTMDPGPQISPENPGLADFLGFTLQPTSLVDLLRVIPSSCEKLVLEVEAPEFMESLGVDGAMEELSPWIREDGKALRYDKALGVRRWEWMGPTAFGDGEVYPSHPSGETMKYVVKVLTFRVEDEGSTPDDGTLGGGARDSRLG